MNILLLIVAIPLGLYLSFFIGSGVMSILVSDEKPKRTPRNIFLSFILGAIILAMLTGIYKGCNNKAATDPSIHYDGN